MSFIMCIQVEVWYGGGFGYCEAELPCVGLCIEGAEGWYGDDSGYWKTERQCFEVHHHTHKWWINICRC